ncbi:aldo/keto reductase [Nocardia sp. IFM 10818]
MLRYRLFGNTGLRISEIILGTMTFDDPVESKRIVDAYADAGGNVLDTASAYGDGEDLLGEILTGRDRFVLATKYTLSRDPDDANAAGNHRKNLTLSLERSLRRLRTDYIDIYWVHLWDPHTPLDETMRALDDAVQSGKILYIGISDAPAWVVARANTLAQWRDRTQFSGLQVPYNLLTRDIERELLPMAETFGMTVTTWAPMAAGKLTVSEESRRVDPATLTDRERAAATAVAKVAADLGATPAQVAIAWTRHRSRAIVPIVGVRTAAQLTENLAAAQVTLPEEAVRDLEAAAPFEPGYLADFLAECQSHPQAFGHAATRLDPR